MSRETKVQNPEVQCATRSVSGSINVCDGARYSQKNIHISTNWTNAEYYTIKDDGECLVITKCFLDVHKKAKKLNNSNHLCIEHSEIQNGCYFFDDEESTEDEAVIYYR